MGRAAGWGCGVRRGERWVGVLGAATWAAQRADTQSQLKTGGIVGGVGVVGGAVGNIIENTTYNGQSNTDVKQSR